MWASSTGQDVVGRRRAISQGHNVLGLGQDVSEAREVLGLYVVGHEVTHGPERRGAGGQLPVGPEVVGHDVTHHWGKIPGTGGSGAERWV